ncbi:hypothetical protein VF_A1083 [Aliivibrio fischeri ES114]|uniref:Uncharacterized protein n=1 Tax=Aliivibrio fischeri (strain ATCC 700601 / ES114) TaxID=312309 RepID=Q5DYJ3_ALIF1|nr:hypothetical protein [Aliivibrio fischeri]AAW88153.1 hypothetical protein VF_A1083 [Aliivibrio fischeri ES114]KLU80627.1 hypothetical protein AB192_02040 [Aliivibrio fischeri]
MTTFNLESYIKRSMRFNKNYCNYISKKTNNFLDLRITKNHISIKNTPKQHRGKIKFTDLYDAISYRNSLYKNNCNIPNLLIKKLPLTRDFHIITSKNTECEYIQINLRNLETYLIEPKIIKIDNSCKGESISLAKAIYESHAIKINKIIHLYNKNRLELINNVAKKELETLTPYLPKKFKFDYNLWEVCYKNSDIN